MSKKTKMTQVPLFINKIYEMIEVQHSIYRIKTTQKLFNGLLPMIPFQLKISPSSQKKSYLNTSSIKISLLSLDNSTCTGSKKYAIHKVKMYT
jgi:hypothetical protein